MDDRSFGRSISLFFFLLFSFLFRVVFKLQLARAGAGRLGSATWAIKNIAMAFTVFFDVKNVKQMTSNCLKVWHYYSFWVF